jgi:pectinesterase
MKQLFLFIALLTTSVGWAAISSSDYHFVVAQDGTGDFRTVQEAVNAVPDFRKGGPTRILIKKGVYKEKLVISNTKDGVQLYGEDGVVLTYDDYAQKPNIFGENKGTSGSSSVYIFGPNFLAENITFQNSSGPVGQAVACHVGADRAVFRRCRFLGFQDTLYTYGENTREYYEDCYIEGTVDFIFGKATCVFNRCELRSKVSGGYLTAPATPQGSAYGYVFFDCRMTADEGVTEGSVWLSRPWRPYGKCVYIRCDLGRHIRPEGWNNWGNPDNEQTAYYAEYQSRGEGAKPGQRVSWSHQLTDISQYDVTTILAGNDGWVVGK